MSYLSQHQSFQSVAALNEALYHYTCDHYFAMNDTDRSVLKMLGRYAVKYVGVAHLKAVTIAQAIGKSEKTVRRALSKLQGLGVIAKVKTLRQVSGGYGANLYVIQPPADVIDQSQVTSRPEAEKPDTTTSEPANKAEEACTYSSAKELSNDNTTTDVPASVSPYVRFKQLIADKKLRNRLYGVWLAHTSYLKGSYAPDVLLNVGITAAMSAYKARGVRNVTAYYHGILDRMLDRLYFAETFSL
ncbi:helix-turn-helix domain-containing protein [Rossellomorea marisflavi]|uniref:helix-turn-helix domain-containing protein n=1 Tax=Rossellomorea marisflavi TaxID=189381 RepID=UPI0011E73E92|nr:helix-turn-helix domain-containing protein [Rossellomorea marisflavi]TYO73069.1 helix-turn-helix domain-containing protein [Rossellomorea marisflavi]